MIKSFVCWLEITFSASPKASVARLKRKVQHIDEYAALIKKNFDTQQDWQKQMLEDLKEIKQGIIKAHAKKDFSDWLSYW